MNEKPKNLPSAADIIELINSESQHWNSNGDQVKRSAIATLLTKMKRLKPAAPSPEEVKTHQESVTDNALIEFAEQEQFLLFCDRDEFVDIARSVLQRFGKSPSPDVSGLVEALEKCLDFIEDENPFGNCASEKARAALSAYKESDK